MTKTSTVRALCTLTVLAMLWSSPGLVSVAASNRTPHYRQADPTVRTTAGLLRGGMSDGVDSFLGIPYAAAPVGQLRWRPPQEAKHWAGVRPAIRYGDRCAALAGTNGPETLSEDCLFLNVQRPTGTHRRDRVPVYMFFHGGGGTTGSSNQHDGRKIVAEGGVIVVTVNYRLGVFGGIGHPALTAEAGESGNYGFQDQQAALKWVQRNISAFGGDPARVTIGGESSGAQNVCYHLSAPRSRGLFSAGIIQSGPDCFSQTQTDAEQAGISIAAAVGCTGVTAVLRCLRGANPSALLQAFDAEQRDHGYNPVIVSGTPTMRNDPRLNVATGNFMRVPLIIGTNLDEARTFFGFLAGASEQDYVDFISSNGAQAPAILEAYSWQSSTEDVNFRAAYLASATVTDSFFACGNRKFAKDLARFTPTWVYEFAHRNGPGLSREPAGYVSGAGHAAELAYLWPSFDNGTPIATTFDPAERELASRMVGYWSSFVTQSHPSIPGGPAWPRWNRQHTLMSLNVGTAMRSITDEQFANNHRCDFWDRLPG